MTTSSVTSEELAYQEALFEYTKKNQPTGLHTFGTLNGFRTAYDSDNKPYLWVPSYGVWFPDWKVEGLVPKSAAQAA